MSAAFEYSFDTRLTLNASCLYLLSSSTAPFTAPATDSPPSSPDTMPSEVRAVDPSDCRFDVAFLTPAPNTCIAFSERCADRTAASPDLAMAETNCPSSSVSLIAASRSAMRAQCTGHCAVRHYLP